MDTTTNHDYVDIINTVNTVSGNKLDPVAALGFYFSHKGTFDKIFGFLKSLYNRKKAIETKADEIPSVNPLNIPAPPQVYIPEAKESGPSLIKSIRNDNHNGVYFLKEWVDGPDTGEVSDKKRFLEVVEGGSAVGKGAQIRYNFTPIGADGQEIQGDDPRHAKVNSGKPYLEYQIKLDGKESEWGQNGLRVQFLEVHNSDYANGCVPYLKVDPVNIAGRHTVQLKARVINGVEGNWTATVNVA